MLWARLRKLFVPAAIAVLAASLATGAVGYVRFLASVERFIGDVVVKTDIEGLTPTSLVGFENHSGRTFLGQGAKPLGRVLRGKGNNGSDKTEGAVQGNIIGTYLHGSLLPKNPHLADYLIRKAVTRRGGDSLSHLDDSAELAAHGWILQRVQRR